jgi:RimJ/RimL family protein N-acetyltransferase
MDGPTLTTDRLVLRMWRYADSDAYVALCADPEVMKFLGGKPMTRLEAWRHLAMLVGHWDLLGYGMWAVDERETGRFVGRVGFNNPDGWPAFEIGWTLAREFWGRGYATEAARVALKYAFEELDQSHVISLIHAENKGSIAVAERLGEKHEGETEIFGIPVRIYGVDRP